MRGSAGGPFGAVVVRDGTIVGTGYNRVLIDNDPTAHAEIVAIRAAAAGLGRYDLSGATLVASCRPCPMCLAATLWSRIAEVWYTNTTADAARIGFDDSRFYRDLRLADDAPDIRLDRFSDAALLAEARAVLDEWLRSPNRRPY